MRAAAATALLALSIALALHPHAASATTYLVETTADEPDYIIGDGSCFSLADQCTLRAAIQDANYRAGADTILIPPGTYRLSVPGLNENAAATGDLDLAGEVTIAGTGPGVVIDGGGIDRVFHVQPGARVTLRDLTIEHGDAGSEDGGGIRSDGTLTLERVTVRANSADDGGGMINFGTITMRSSLVTENAADDVGGGFQNDAVMTVLQSTVSGNAGPFGGGGINNRGAIDVVASTVSGNTSASGRGAGINNIGTLHALNATVSGNSGHFSGAGVANTGSMTLESTTIAENTASEAGGGLYNAAAGAVLSHVLLATNVGGNCNLTQPAATSYTFDTGPTCSLTGPGDLGAVDVQLGPLADNGGPVRTHALAPSGPAVDAGAPFCAALDARGVARPVDGDGDHAAACDIGAFEYAPGTPGPVGDVHCDGSVSSIDTALLLQRVAQLLAAFSCPARPDANGDGALNAIDATLILQYVAGLIGRLPP